MSTARGAERAHDTGPAPSLIDLRLPLGNSSGRTKYQAIETIRSEAQEQVLN